MEFTLPSVAAGFAALAQQTRLSLLQALAEAGPIGVAAGDLATRLGQSPSSVSFHLSALEQAGLIQSVRRGRQVIYAVRLEGFRDVFGFLAETCFSGQPGHRAELMRLLPCDLPEPSAVSPAFNVLFLCTRNSARSIMAEAILRSIAAFKFNAYSAGSKPAASAMPDVLARLAAMGHDITPFRPKSWDEFTRPHAPRMNFVLTLCDPQAGEICPEFAGQPVTATWPFPDPAKFNGSAVERATLVFELYGMIRRRLEAFIVLPFQSLDRMTLAARLDEIGSR